MNRLSNFFSILGEVHGSLYKEIAKINFLMPSITDGGFMSHVSC
jgi:hypothetical protein